MIYLKIIPQHVRDHPCFFSAFQLPLYSIMWLYLGLCSQSFIVDIWVASKSFIITNCVAVSSLVHLFVFLLVYLWFRLLEMGLLGRYLASFLQKRLAYFPGREMYNFVFPPAEQKCLFSHGLAKSVCRQTFFFS